MPLRSLFCFCFFMLLIATARSQVLIALLFGDKLNTEKLEFGLLVGPNFSTISNSEANGRTGLGLGLYFNIKLSDKFFFHPSVLPKSVFGGKDIPIYPLNDPNLDDAFKGGSVERKLPYISMPFLFRYRIKGLWFAEAGPQLSLRRKAKDVFHKEVDGGDLEYVKGVKDDYTRFDFGAAFGLVKKFKDDKGMGIGVRFYQGFIDVGKAAPGSQLNSGLLVYVSFAVGVKKAQSKSK